MFKKLTSKLLPKLCGSEKISKQHHKSGLKAETENSLELRKQFLENIGIRLQKFCIYRAGQEAMIGLNSEGKDIWISIVKIPSTIDVQEIYLTFSQIIAKMRTWNHPFLAGYINLELSIDAREIYIFSDHYRNKLSLTSISSEAKLQKVVFQILRGLEFLRLHGVRSTGRVGFDFILTDEFGNVKLQDVLSNNFKETIACLEINGTKNFDALTKNKEDFVDLKNLLFEVIQKLKVSSKCIDFISLMEFQIKNDIISIEELLDHQFLTCFKNDEVTESSVHNTHSVILRGNYEYANNTAAEYSTIKTQNTFNSPILNKKERHPFIMELNQSNESLQLNTSSHLNCQYWSKRKISIDTLTEGIANKSKSPTASYSNADVTELKISNLLNEQNMLMKSHEFNSSNSQFNNIINDNFSKEKMAKNLLANKNNKFSKKLNLSKQASYDSGSFLNNNTESPKLMRKLVQKEKTRSQLLSMLNKPSDPSKFKPKTLAQKGKPSTYNAIIEEINQENLISSSNSELEVVQNNRRDNKTFSFKIASQEASPLQTPCFANSLKTSKDNTHLNLPNITFQQNKGIKILDSRPLSQSTEADSNNNSMDYADHEFFMNLHQRAKKEDENRVESNGKSIQSSEGSNSSRLNQLLAEKIQIKNSKMYCEGSEGNPLFSAPELKKAKSSLFVKEKNFNKEGLTAVNMDEYFGFNRENIAIKKQASTNNLTRANSLVLGNLIRTN